MIHVIFEGRLGNNLFQYAAARTLDKDVVICIPYKEYYDNAIKYKWISRSICLFLFSYRSKIKV